MNRTWWCLNIEWTWALDGFQPRPNGWMFHSAGLMQSGSPEDVAPPSLQPHNKACNYCSFLFVHLSNSPSLHLGPCLTYLTPSFTRHFLPAVVLRSSPLHLCLPFFSSAPFYFTSIYSSSTLLITASLCAPSPADFLSNEAGLWQQPLFNHLFLTALFCNPSSYIHIYIFMFLPPSEPPHPPWSVWSWWCSAPLADSAPH